MRLMLRLRNRHFLVLDFLALSLTPALALVLRTDGTVLDERYLQPLAVFTLAALVCKLLLFFPFGLYARYWRYASIEELGLIVFATFSALILETLLFFGALRPLGLIPLDFPRSIPFLDGLLTVLVVGGGRFSVRLAMRLYRQRWVNGRHTESPSQPVLIMGAGDAGAMIVRELQNNPHLGLEPVGFLDDDLGKHDVKIHGVPVLGDRHAIPAAVQQHQVRQVIIAMPTARGVEIRDIVRICGEAGVQARIIPGIYELLDGSVSVKQVRDVRIEDLLRREPVRTDVSAVSGMLRGKRVLVTGAGLS